MKDLFQTLETLWLVICGFDRQERIKYRERKEAEHRVKIMRKRYSNFW